MHRQITLLENSFDAGAMLEEWRKEIGDASMGALVSFRGMMRKSNQKNQPLKQMILFHYPAMTHKNLETLFNAIEEKWSLKAAMMVHRYGCVLPEDNIVLCATASKHRATAFDACHFLIERLKTDIPFWKQEETLSGEQNWVVPESP